MMKVLVLIAAVVFSVGLTREVGNSGDVGWCLETEPGCDGCFDYDDPECGLTTPPPEWEKEKEEWIKSPNARVRHGQVWIPVEVDRSIAPALPTAPDPRYALPLHPRPETAEFDIWALAHPDEVDIMRKASTYGKSTE